MNGGLAYLGLAEAAELIRTKKLSPVEYVTALLARIERYDAKYNAFIALSSRPKEFHLRALPEPCMTLSSHTAPDVRPLP